MKDYEEKKQSIIKELARLESMDWMDGKKIIATIFPYVLPEAINLLKNSKPVVNQVDYTKTGKDMKKMLKELES